MPIFKKRVLKELRASAGIDGPGLRRTLNALRSGFLQEGTSIPALQGTKVNADQARALYYNRMDGASLGAFMVASIIDGTADFIGLPEVTYQDEQKAASVNDWIQNYWQSSIWQIYRNALRDSSCWVRLRLPYPDVLLADEEANICQFEVIDKDRVRAYHDPITNQLTRVEISSEVWIEEERFDPSMITATGARIYGRLHELVEIITPDSYYFYDETDQQYLQQYTTSNLWKFIPLVEVFNDYDSALQGGKSEVEQAMPFIFALHELVQQTRDIHTYHADPKVRFKLDDVMTFIQNNWPNSIVDGKFTGSVSWRDRDVFFMEAEDDASFIEATLNENSSVNFAEFLIDCICMAAQVTEGVLFRAHAEEVTVDTDEFFRFKRKIERKRLNLQEDLQKIFKMATKISFGQAVRLDINWPPISISDLAAEGQAMNQVISAAEVANRAGVISKKTYGTRIRRFFPGMKDPQAEQSDVQTEMDSEESRTLAYEKQLADIKGPQTTSGTGTNNGGINGAIRSYGRKRASLPLDVVSPPSGD